MSDHSRVSGFSIQLQMMFWIMVFDWSCSSLWIKSWKKIWTCILIVSKSMNILLRSPFWIIDLPIIVLHIFIFIFFYFCSFFLPSSSLFKLFALIKLLAFFQNPYLSYYPFLDWKSFCRQLFFLVSKTHK